jgi:malate dehydrogenase (oxaloacetate-decarboxylating)(NADP+)
LIGRPAVIDHRIAKFGLRMKAGDDFEVVNPESDARYRDFWQTYLSLTERKGVTESFAKLESATP